MNKSIRFSKSSDLNNLHEIWKQVFQSGDGDLFFEHFFVPNRCILAESDGKPVSMGFLLPVGDYTIDDTSRSCAMIYALATLPEYRSNGFASAIVQELIETGYNSGYNAIILCPSSDDLFDYYSQSTAFRENFYICEKKHTTLGTCEENFTVSEASPDEYLAIRDSLLSHIPHVKMDINAIMYQSKLSKFTGGKLIKVDIDGVDSCAAIEVYENGAILIKELLTPDGYQNAILSVIGTAFPSHEYTIRTPAKIYTDQDAHVRRFGMIATTDNIVINSYAQIAPWYGFAFD